MVASSKTEITAPDLPTPDERPGADVVIYDGVCPICTGSSRLLHKLDVQGRLAFLSLDDPRVRRRYPDLSHDDLMAHVHVVDRQGRRYKGAAAVRYLARRLPALWPLAPALHVPGSMPLWRWLYDQVARRRYLTTHDACSSQVCQPRPKPESPDRVR